MKFLSRQYFLSRAKMIAFLDGLETSADEAKSLYMPAGLSLPEARKLLEASLDPKLVPPESAGVVVASRTGAVLFWSLLKTWLVLPPFPIAAGYSAPGYAVGRLRSQLQRDYRIALVLVRLGSFAVGVCAGERLIASKVGTGLVHARHRQGGSSAQRFGLHRQKQIESFLDRVCAHAQERLGQQHPDYLAYGGARTTIMALQKQCPFLQQFSDRMLPPLLDIPEPRQAVLEAAVGRVWSSKVVEWSQTA